MEYIFKQYINGEWVEAINGGKWDIINPATGKLVNTVPYGDSLDVAYAISCAQNSFIHWANVSVSERCKILKRAADLLEKEKNYISTIVTQESGKPLSQSISELLVCARLLEWFGEEAKRAYGRIIPATNKERIFVKLQPIGVVASITAWNFPAYLPCRIWSAALAAGCTVVARPSELTPLSAMSLVNILVKSGLPKGVLNLVNGDPELMTKEMLKNPLCRKISFTGSKSVGKKIIRGAAATITKVTLELGGNAPVIILPDADLVKAANASVTFKFRHAGQICNAPSRFYIHKDIVDNFLEYIISKTKKLKIGNGLIKTTQVGPLINQKKLLHIQELIEDAVTKGARIEVGGKCLVSKELKNGNFFAPTILSNVNASMRVMNEEIFGPVLPIQTFSRIEEVVKLANDTEYGLAAFLWTNDINKAINISELLECGQIGINCLTSSAPQAPFGGIKQSGIGQECGSEGLLNYLNTKTVIISISN